MENKKPLLPKRFIIRVLCNNCGMNSQVQLTWLPDQRLAFECFTCGEAEIFYLGAELPKDDLPLTTEELKVLGDLAERHKERVKN